MFQQALQKYFQFPEFRVGQEEIVRSIVEGKDTVALMPTGGGKSLCYQLPGLLMDGVTLVVSPLIALMKDQVDGLKVREIPATFVNSSLNGAEVSKRFQEIKDGKVKLVYVAPERLTTEGFQNFLKQIPVSLVAVDEAHCVSAWGHDFRPEYMGIRKVIDGLSRRPVIGAFTATATPEVKEDIVRRLGLKNPQVFVRGFDRPNLKFFARSNLKVLERKRETLRIIKALEGSGVVYALTRRESEEMAEWLNEEGVTAVAYHAGLRGEQRTRIQEEFMENQYKVIVATVAFGMGVDKADIRFVIHMGMPSSLEGYYQEAGRAGRDGEQAFCVLLHSGKDTGLHHHFIQLSRQEMKSQGKPWEEISSVVDIKYRKLEKMVGYVTEESCRRRKILEYFGDAEVVRFENGCKSCDVCLNYKWQTSKEGDARSKKRFHSLRSGAVTIKELSGTVKDTIRLYEQGYGPKQIAKMRNLGISTIFGHLLQWHSLGGKFDIDEFIGPGEEVKVMTAMRKAKDASKLSEIKQLLPENISYDTIRMVLAKRGG